jgi:hypothetical protein
MSQSPFVANGHYQGGYFNQSKSTCADQIRQNINSFITGFLILTLLIVMSYFVMCYMNNGYDSQNHEGYVCVVATLLGSLLLTKLAYMLSDLSQRKRSVGAVSYRKIDIPFNAVS